MTPPFRFKTLMFVPHIVRQTRFVFNLHWIAATVSRWKIWRRVRADDSTLWITAATTHTWLRANLLQLIRARLQEGVRNWGASCAINQVRMRIRIRILSYAAIACSLWRKLWWRRDELDRHLRGNSPAIMNFGTVSEIWIKKMNSGLGIYVWEWQTFQLLKWDTINQLRVLISNLLSFIIPYGNMSPAILIFSLFFFLYQFNVWMITIYFVFFFIWSVVIILITVFILALWIQY